MIHALGGHDVVLGGPGEDVLAGGPGNDRHRGGGGDDVLRGIDGVDANDELMGGGGADRCHGDGGDALSTAPNRREPRPAGSGLAERQRSLVAPRATGWPGRAPTGSARSRPHDRERRVIPREP